MERSNLADESKKVRVSSGLLPHSSDEGEASLSVSCVDISLQADQQPADFRFSVLRLSSTMKRGRFPDQSEEVRVSSRLCPHINNEGEASPSVSCVDISLQADQQPAYFEVTSATSFMKRSRLADESKVRVSN